MGAGGTNRAWAAGKYLTYGFWRSWILVVYTAPIWSYFALGADAASPASVMYLWSTVTFCAASCLLAAFHRRAQAPLSNRWVILAAGLASAAGVLVEYAALALAGDPAHPAFVAGAGLTGVGTAFVAVRAGQIYARTRPTVAATNTALSEVAAGLLFFFVIGTLPEAALVIAAGLPLLASLMAWFDGPTPPDQARVDPDPPERPGREGRRGTVVPFLRFLVMVFVLTFVSSYVKGAFDAVDPDTALSSGILGVTVATVVSFALALACSMTRSFNFGAIYYPLVLLLAVAVILVFVLDAGSAVPPAAVSVFVYSMSSLFMWVLLSFLARGRHWDAVQVFGWGRAVFALGSLAGRLCSGVGPLSPGGAAGGWSLTLGLLLAFATVACGMLVFRDSDVRLLMDAGETDVQARATGPAEVGDEVATHVGTSADRGTALPEAPSDAGASSEARLTPTDFADAHGLTDREREVFALMLDGRDARFIAGALVISENTAKAHIRSVYAKAGTHTRQGFVEATKDVRRP